MKLLSSRDEAVLYLSSAVLVLCLEFAVIPLPTVRALNNSITVTNLFTSALTAVPIIFGRAFAPGDVIGFPKPYVKPSSTGIRAAATTWQAHVRNYHRDATSVRTIIAGMAGSPVFTVANGGLTDVSVASNLASVTLATPPTVPIALGDQFTVEGTPATANNPYPIDNIIVSAITDTTHFSYISRFNTNGTFNNTSATPTVYNAASVALRQKIDGMEPSDVCRFQTSAPHNLYRGEVVTIPNTMTGLTILSPTGDNRYIVTGHTDDEIVINRSCSGAGWTSGGSITGPDFGSVKFAYIGVFVDVPASGGTNIIDFASSANPSSAGNAAATEAAGMTEAQLLALPWNFDMEATASVKTGSTATLAASPRTILTAGDLTVPTDCGTRVVARGPVFTEVIVEEGCRGATGSDLGWKNLPDIQLTQALNATAGSQDVTFSSTADLSAGMVLWTSGETMTVNSVDTGCTAPCANITRATPTGTATSRSSGYRVGIRAYEDGTAAHESLHPQFTITAFASGGWGVMGSTTIKSNYVTKIQNLYYSAKIKTGSTPTDRFTTPTFKHTGNASVNIDLVDGTDPEFFCSGGSGTDPNNCSGTGGGTRRRKYIIDHNTPYMISARVGVPEYIIWQTPVGIGSEIAGFAASDKGAIGTTIGAGTFNVQPGAADTSAVRGFLSAQEAYMFPDVQAKCLQLWNEDCYEINQGVSVPGGGGNSNAQGGMPWHYLESDETRPRYIFPGFPLTEAFGKPISLFSRPTWIAQPSGQFDSDIAIPDKFSTACSAAAPMLVPDDGANHATEFWPCFYLGTGLDGWAFDETHVNDHLAFNYMITGKLRYLDGILSQASWITGWNTVGSTTPSRGMGRSWVQPESQTTANNGTEIRQQGGWTRSAMNAAIFSPDQPMFGLATAGAWTYYWRHQIWNIAFAKEGFFGETAGWYPQFYPSTHVSDCGTASTLPNIWRRTWCTVAAQKSNPLGFLGLHHHGSTSCTPTYPWIDCDPYIIGAGFWYYWHSVNWWGMAADMGWPMFQYVRERWANTAISMSDAQDTASEWNPYMSSMYQVPNRFSATNEFVQTLAEMYTGLNATWTGAEAGSNNQQNLDWYSGSESPTGYPNQFRAGIASFSDLKSTVVGTRDGCPVGGCLWQTAMNFWDAAIPAANQALWDNTPKFSLYPKAIVNDLVCVPGITTAACTFTPPSTAACTFAASTAFTDSLDDGDTAAGDGTFNLSGLTANQSYSVRLTCGQRVTGKATGTGRVFAEFQTGFPRTGFYGRGAFGGRIRIGQ